MSKESVSIRSLEDFISYVEKHIEQDDRGEGAHTIPIEGNEPWHSVKFQKLDAGEDGKFCHYAKLRLRVADYALGAWEVASNSDGSLDIGPEGDHIEYPPKHTGALTEADRFVQFIEPLIGSTPTP